MEYQFIQTQIDGNVLIIRLNRPDVLNSFTIPMAKEVQHVLDYAAQNESVRAVYLTGNGRGFCAGQDLSEAIAEQGPSIQTIVNETYNPIITKIRSIEKPIIGGVNGVAAGAGANIAFACDITFAAETVNFIQSFSKIGLIPDSGGTYTLPRLVGMQRATALTFLADKISAAEAQQYGLIWKVTRPEELDKVALETAHRLAAMPTIGLGLTKRALNAGLENSLETQLKLEADLQDLASKSQDHKEGVQAFLQKRTPTFTGK